MAVVLPVSKRGSITLPPELRKKLGIDQIENPMLMVGEKDGSLVLEPATAIPLRDIPESKIKKWISEDEQALESFLKTK
jgi:bifunctional DNA-binding transcriptional regulator/antitoxin component of YhaV-PrlF toxin-antitoxin module